MKNTENRIYLTEEEIECINEYSCQCGHKSIDHDGYGCMISIEEFPNLKCHCIKYIKVI